MQVKIFTVGRSNGDGSASIDCFPSESKRQQYLDDAVEHDKGIVLNDDEYEDKYEGYPIYLGDAHIEIEVVDGKPIIVSDFSVYVDGV